MRRGRRELRSKEDTSYSVQEGDFVVGEGGERGAPTDGGKMSLGIRQAGVLA